MKNIIFFLFFLFSISAKGQFLPNGNFETWISMQFSAPDHWQTHNNYTVTLPDTAATKVVGQSGFAVRLEKEYYSNPIVGNGYFFDSTGGEPYSQQPTGLDITVRYDIYPGDSSRTYVFFKNNGAVIMTDTFSIGGQHTPGFITHHFDFSNPFPMSPDSVIVYITSGDPFNNLPTGPGFIEIDQLTFTGATQQLVNSGFDNWNIVTAEEPYDWGSGGQVSKTTDNYEGNFAAKLESYFEVSDEEFPVRYSDVIVTPQITTHNFVVEGYYKYITPGIDSGRIVLSMIGMSSDPDVGEEVMHQITHVLPPVNSYTYFSLPIASEYILDFDLTHIEFYSSLEEPFVAVEGSTLFLDGIRIVDPTAVPKASFKQERIQVYPNPVSDVLNVIFEGDTEPWTITIFDMKGAKIALYDGDKKSTTIPVKDLSGGIYFYEVRKGSNVVRNKFLKN